MKAVSVDVSEQLPNSLLEPVSLFERGQARFEL